MTPAVINSPRELLSLAVDYLARCISTPLNEPIVKIQNGSTYHAFIPRPRVATLEAFCAGLPVSLDQWAIWRRPGNEFAFVTSQIEALIRDHTLTLAAAGMLSPVIAARLLGLKDAKEIDMKADITARPVLATEVTQAEIDAELERRRSRVQNPDRRTALASLVERGTIPVDLAVDLLLEEREESEGRP